MKFSYAAVNTSGKRVKGKISADNETEAINKLRAEKLVPVSLTEIKVIIGVDGKETENAFEREIFEKEIHKQKFKHKKLIVVFDQLAIMLKAGVNLSMAIEVMMDNQDDKRVCRLLRAMHADLMNGIALSASMDTFAAFDDVSVNIVRAGEADGRLERSFARIAQVMAKQGDLISKVQTAAIYPCVLLVLVIGVLIMINTVVLPSFITMFENIGKDLPGITVMVMNASDFLSKYGLIIAGGIVLICLAYAAVRRKSRSFAIAVDHFKLSIPLVGKLILHSQTARFARILSTLIEAGQDFVSALTIAQSVLSNKYMIDGLENVSSEVCMGNSVSDAMAKQPFFAPVFISMMRAGEESGNLGETLTKMADMYEDQTEESTKRVTTMMEPLMTMIIAVIVGVVVISIALPMFGMMDLVGTM